MTSTFHLGDAANFDTLVGPESLDCIVQDPPAGVNFMSASFDRDHGGRDAWIKLHASLFAAGRRALKPGAWCLTWALPRTSGWTQMALEDAGYEITDCITSLNGQGWPKNARTQLKPSSEHWYLARNGGGGSLQIDACRVVRGAVQSSAGGVGGYGKDVDSGTEYQQGTGREYREGGSWPTNALLSHCDRCEGQGTREVKGANSTGTAPRRTTGYGSGTRISEFGADYSANGLETVSAFDCLAACSCGLTALAPSGGQPPRCDCGEAMSWACVVALLDEQSGQSKSNGGPRVNRVRNKIYGASSDEWSTVGRDDSGGASRYFTVFSFDSREESLHAYVCPNEELNPLGATSASPKADGIESGASLVVGNCINRSRVDGCGNVATDRSQPVTRSTIEITTTATTRLTTLNALPPNGMTTTINGCEKTTEPLTELSNESVSVALNTRGSNTSRCAELGPITDIAACAQRRTFVSGRRRIETPSSRTGALDTQPGYPRSFYAAKAATAERHAGAEHLRWARDKDAPLGYREIDRATFDTLPANQRGTGNIHPTIKSLKLARWLVRLLCPQGGRGGDPFCGSGSIGIAAMLEGFNWVSSDLSPEAIRIAQARLTHWQGVAAQPVKSRKATKAIKQATVSATPQAQGTMFNAT